ncbi:MAG: heavy-metal-associated domain-containing protein [Lachnospiraceae bacterium]
MVKTTLKIDGMMCGMCESHVNEAIRRDFKVKKVNSSHAKKETEIISEDALNEEKLKAVIEETGYQLLSVTSEPYEKKGLFGFGKNN